MALGRRLSNAVRAFFEEETQLASDIATGVSIQVTADLSAKVLAEVTTKIEALEERLQVAKVGTPVGLTPGDLRKVGVLALADEHSDAVEHHVMEQRTAYDHATKEDLIETLLARDRELITQGKRLADGTIGSRVLRETMRAALYATEGKADPAKVERVLTTMMGADPADARQLKLHGSTLGPLEDPAARAQQLVEGSRTE